MSDFAKEKLAATGKELCEERDEAMEVCKAWAGGHLSCHSLPEGNIWEYFMSFHRKSGREAHPQHRRSCYICIRIVTMTCVKYTVTV